MTETIPVLDLSLPDEGDCESALWQILKVIRPQWKEEDVSIEVMVGGIMNHLWKCCCKDNNEDQILIKKYGVGTEKFMDRNKEFLVMSVLSEEGIIMPVYAKFSNGIAYRCKKGHVLSPKEILDTHISKLVMQKMHDVHAININERTGQEVSDSFLIGFPAVFDIFKGLAFDHFDDDESYRAIYPPRKELVRELEGVLELYKQLTVEFPCCLVHFDPHLLNIIYDKDADDLTFVDWEAVGVGLELMDLANYITRDPTSSFHANGVDFVSDVGLLQSYVRMYLKGHPSFEGKAITDQLLHKWCIGLLKTVYVCAMSIVPWSFLENRSQIEDKHVMRLGMEHFTLAQNAKVAFKSLQNK